MFDPLPIKDGKPIAYLKRFFVIVCSAFLVIYLISGYRAWFQIHSLNVTADQILRSGSTINTNVVSYGRTFVTVRTELIQGQHIETIALQRVPGNAWGLFDPRVKREAQAVVLPPELMARFSSGGALVRATAIGGPQWTRTPPPVVRELNVEIKHDY